MYRDRSFDKRFMKIFSINSNNNCILFKQQRKHPISKGECDVVNFGASKIDIKDKQLAVDCAHLANYAYPSQKSTKLPDGYEDITAKFSNVDLGEVRASVFKNSSQERIYIAYSGTYNPVQFAKNAVSALSNKPRNYYDNADLLFNAVHDYAKKDLPPKDIVVIGHSSGGGLAQYVAAKNDSYSYAITYAAAGIGQFIDDLQIERRNYPKIVNYITKRDPVTNPFFDNIGEIYAVPLNSHGIAKLNSHGIANYMKPGIYSKAKKLNPIACLKVSSTSMLGEILRQAGRGVKNGGVSVLNFFKK